MCASKISALNPEITVILLVIFLSSEQNPFYHGLTAKHLHDFRVIGVHPFSKACS